MLGCEFKEDNMQGLVLCFALGCGVTAWYMYLDFKNKCKHKFSNT